MKFDLEGSEFVAMKETWSISWILYTYLVACLGSHCTIRIMDKWRSTNAADTQYRSILMAAASLSMGGCSIWTMHFTCMSALTLTFPIPLENATLADLRNCTDCVQPNGSLVYSYDGFLSILSFITSILFTWIGLLLASKDKFFEEVELGNRRKMLLNEMETLDMKTIVNKKKSAKKIKMRAYFSKLTQIRKGGFCAAMGVVGTQTLGMMAQDVPCELNGNIPLLLFAMFFAYIANLASFWLIFRVLTFNSNDVNYRYGSVLLMGFAICGTQFSGLFGVTYYYDPNASFKSAYLFRMTSLFGEKIAIQGSIICCYLLFYRFVLTANHSWKSITLKSSATSRRY